MSMPTAMRRGNWDYMSGPMEAIRHFTRVDAHITFCGHVHVPMLYHMSTTAKVGAFSPVANNDIPLLPTRTWLAVIGAVGQPRDGVAAANYAVFDTARQTLRYLRVPYDTATAARKVREAGLARKAGASSRSRDDSACAGASSPAW